MLTFSRAAIVKDCLEMKFSRTSMMREDDGFCASTVLKEHDMM